LRFGFDFVFAGKELRIHGLKREKRSKEKEKWGFFEF